LLADVAAGQQEMFDAGRRIPAGRSNVQLGSETAKKRGSFAAHGAGNTMSAARHHRRRASRRVRSSEPRKGGVKRPIDLRPTRGTVRVIVTPAEHDWVDHHIWSVEIP